MEQKKKHNRNIYIVLAVVLCLAGVFFVKDAVRAVEDMAYPRTYAALVQQYAAEYGVDENKVYAIIRTESGFKPEAESKVGARGLMQITDETFLWIKSKIAPGEEITFDDLFDPAVNIRFGTYLLANCGGGVPQRHGACGQSAAEGGIFCGWKNSYGIPL